MALLKYVLKKLFNQYFTFAKLSLKVVSKK